MNPKTLPPMLLNADKWVTACQNFRIGILQMEIIDPLSEKIAGMDFRG